MIINAVSYARFSSNNQREASIEIQQEHINRYCKDNGMTIIKEYVDRAMTATSDNRPQFQQMIKDAESGLFSYVIVYNTSRFCRNIQDHLRYRSILESYGIRLISVQESFDETTPEGDLMSNFMMSINQYYSRDLGRKTYLGCLETAKEGKAVGGRPPYGYRVNDEQKYEINEEEATIIRLVFDLTEKGMNNREISDYLTENGYKNRKGKVFEPDFSWILRNKKYIGIYTWNVRQRSKITKALNPDLTNRGISSVIMIPDGMPRIISDEQFYKIQKIVDERRTNRNSLRTEYLLSGILRCGYCGYKLYVDKNNNGNGKRTYVRMNYRCYSYARKRADCKCCDLKVQNMDSYITNLIFNVLLNERYAKSIYRLIKSKIGKDYDEKHKRLTENQIKINKTMIEVKNLISSLAEARSIAYQEILKEIERLTQVKEQLEKENTNIGIELESYPVFNERTIESRITALKGNIKSKTVECLKPIIRLLFKEIVVNNEIIKSKINLNAYLPKNSKVSVEMEVLEDTENIKNPDKQMNQKLSWSELELTL